jgi:hypothetical protein
MEYRQFDVVRLISDQRVKYLSGPPGRATAPKGEWSIVGFVERDAVLAKQSTIIRVPVGDIERIAEYDKKVLADKLKSVGKPQIDVVQSVSKILGIALDKARALCKQHKVPLVVDSKFYEEKAIERLKDVIGFREENDSEERKE